VQRHFGTKAGLRDAINDYVVVLATEAFADLPSDGDPAEIQQRMGDLVTSFVSQNATALRYVARAVADRDPGAMDIFAAFAAISRAQWQRLDDHGLLRPGADIEWAALHVVVLNLATVLMRDAIERHLPAPFGDPAQLERWNQATNALFHQGLYRRP
jgi:AcrR family transcriptional regulator